MGLLIPSTVNVVFKVDGTLLALLNSVNDKLEVIMGASQELLDFKTNVLDPFVQNVSTGVDNIQTDVTNLKTKIDELTAALADAPLSQAAKDTLAAMQGALAPLQEKVTLLDELTPPVAPPV